MAKQLIQVEVEKATYDLGQALAGLAISVKEHAAKGKGVGEILSAVSENMPSLIQAFMEAGQIPAEITEDSEAFANSAGLMGSKILGALVKKSPASAATPSA